MAMLDAIGDAKQLEVVRAYPEKIFQIPNPTEQAKLVAVKHDGMWLERLQPCSKRVEEAAVKNNGMALQFVKSQTKTMKLDAVTQNGLALQFIKGASYALKKVAVLQNGLAIQHIMAPNDKLWEMAIEQNGNAIQWHKNPSEPLMLEAVTSMDPDVILHIDNPPESVKRRAVECSGVAIKHLPKEEQTRDLQRSAVRAQPHSIEYIFEPAEEVQVDAVRQNAGLIHRIYRPCMAAIEVAKEKGIQI